MVQRLATWSDHDLLGSLGGFGFVTGGRITRNTELRLHIARATGLNQRMGIACAGLIDPQTCPEESLEDDSRVLDAGVGVERMLARRGIVTVSLQGDLSLAWIRARTRGQASGRTLSADKSLGGVGTGLEVAFSPFPDTPLALVTGARGSLLYPIVRDQTPDAYTPFEGATFFGRLWVGVAWYPRH